MGCCQEDKNFLTIEDPNKKTDETKKIKEKKVNSIDAKKLMLTFNQMMEILIIV